MPFLAYVDRMYVGLSACLIITYLTLFFSLVMMIIKAKNLMLHLRRSFETFKSAIEDIYFSFIFFFV